MFGRLVYRLVGALLCLIISGLNRTNAATVNASVTPKPALKGKNYTVRCGFKLGLLDLFYYILLTSVNPSGGGRTIASFYFNYTVPAWDSQAPEDLKRRGRLDVVRSRRAGNLYLVVTGAECRDHGRMYGCFLHYSREFEKKPDLFAQEQASVELKGLIACTTERHSSCPAGDRPNSFTVTVQCMLLTCAPSSNCATLRGPGGRRCQLDDSHKTCSSNPGGCSCQTPVNGHSVYDRKLTPSRNESASWSCDDTCLDIYPATPHREEGDEDNPVDDYRNVDIIMSPQLLSLQPDRSLTGGRVTISCQVTGIEATDKVITIKILKRGWNTETVLVSASVSSPTLHAVLEPGSGLTGATVSGGVDTQRVTLTLSRARCNRDEGVYTCSAAVLKLNPQGSVHVRDDKRLSIEVSAGQVTMTVTSSGSIHRLVGDRLAMTCTAAVGTVHTDTEVQWMWEWQYTHTVPASHWNQYDGNPSDIRDGLTVTEFCYERRGSTLTRQLSPNDSDRVYRCYIKRREGSRPFNLITWFAAKSAVGTVRHAPPGPVTLTATPPSKTSWTVGDTLTLTCNASVGTVDAYTQVRWVWEWRNTQSGITNWSDYDGNSVDIQEGPTQQSRYSYQLRSSKLTRQLSVNDTNREYRCYVRRRQGQGSFVAYDKEAAEHAVGIVRHVLLGSFVAYDQKAAQHAVHVGIVRYDTPGQATLTAEPDDTTHRAVGDTLAMTCKATVGTVDAATQIQWVWEWRNTQPDLTSFWHAYDGNSADIQDGRTTQQDRHQRQSSTLTRQLTVEDTNREYRCYVRRRQGQGTYTAYKQLAALYSVGVVTDPNAVSDSSLVEVDVLSSAPTSTVSLSSSTSASTVTDSGTRKIGEAMGSRLSSTELAGVIVGVILLLIGLSTGGWFFYWFTTRRRRLRKGNTGTADKSTAPQEVVSPAQAKNESKPKVLRISFEGLPRSTDQESVASSSSQASFQTDSSATESSATEIH